MKSKTIKNFFTKKELDNFFFYVFDDEFPWYRGVKVLHSLEKKQHQLRHVFLTESFGKSFCFDGVAPILDKFLKKTKAKKIVRAKINLTYNSGKSQNGGWHKDYDDDSDCKVAILYLNTNNGYTKLKDGTKFPSVKNTVVMFDNVEHTDVTQTNTEERIVLNIGFVA